MTSTNSILTDTERAGKLTSDSRGAADFFTLGLAEVALTPTEGVTKNEKHPVTVCYNGQKLVRIDDKGQPILAEDKNPPITAASSPTSTCRHAAQRAAAAIASDQPKTDSKPAAPTSSNPAATTTANPPAAVIPVTASVNPSAEPASPAVPNVIPAAAVMSPAAAPVNPGPVVNPAVGDQWKSTDHPE